MDEWLTPPTFVTDQIVTGDNLRRLYEGADFVYNPKPMDERGTTGVTFTANDTSDAWVDYHASRYRGYFDWTGRDVFVNVVTSIQGSTSGMNVRYNVAFNGVLLATNGLFTFATPDTKDMQITIPKIFKAATLTGLGLVPGNIEAVVKYRRNNAGVLNVQHDEACGIFIVEI